MPNPGPVDRPRELTFRRSGRSGLMLPPLSLGLWQNFGERSAAADRRALILEAFTSGIVHFDLANNYGPPGGAAETAFGEVLARDLPAHRDDMVIATKAGYLMHVGPYGEWGSRKHLLSSLDASLRRLGVDNVDIFYHHRPDPGTPIEETANALADAVTRGKTRYLGVSSYSPEQVLDMERALRERGVPLTVFQGRYSMFDRHVEWGLLDQLAASGIGFVAYSPLAQGMLTNRYLSEEIPAGSRAATSTSLPGERLDDEYRSRTRALDTIARGRGQSLAQLALSWALRNAAVTSAIVGASRPEQLRDSLQSVDAPEFTPDELAALDTFAVHGTGRAEQVAPRPA